VRLALALLALAAPLAAVAGPDPAALAAALEAKATELAKPLAVPSLGHVTVKQANGASQLALTLPLELVPDLLDALTPAHPELGYAALAFANAYRAYDAAGGAKVVPGSLRLTLVPRPSLAPDPAARAAFLRAVAAQSTTEPDRFLAGGRLLVRNLEVSPEGNARLEAAAVSSPELLAAVRRLSGAEGPGPHLEAAQVKRVIWEPYRGRTIQSFELQGMAASGAVAMPSPDAAALADALAFVDAYAKLFAPVADAPVSRASSLSFESGKVRFNLSGVAEGLAAAPRALADAHFADAGEFALALEPGPDHLSGDPREFRRARVVLTAQHLPAAAPPAWAARLAACLKASSTAPDDLVGGRAPALLESFRLPAHDPLEVSVLVRDLPSLQKFVDQASGPDLDLVVTRVVYEQSPITRAFALAVTLTAGAAPHRQAQRAVLEKLATLMDQRVAYMPLVREARLLDWSAAAGQRVVASTDESFPPLSDEVHAALVTAAKALDPAAQVAGSDEISAALRQAIAPGKPAAALAPYWLDRVTGRHLTYYALLTLK